MRVLICGLNYHPEIIGIAVYTTDLSRFLSKMGHQTTVVTAHPHYPEWRHREGWPKLGYTAIQEPSGPKIIHCPLYVPAKPSFSKRLLHYFSFLFTSLPITLWTCMRERPNVVIAIAPSLISAISALICGRLTGAKIALHIQDFEVDAAFATKVVNADGFVAKIALGFERWMLRRFDMVSTISTAMMRKANEKGVPKDRIVEFRNWADLSAIKPLDGPSPMRATLGLIEKHVVLYSGNISAKQGLDIIPAAARLLTGRRDLVFVICGNGPYLETLIATCGDLKNVRFLPLQPFAELSNLLGMADIHLLPQIADVEELVLPSKLANMLASGRPVIATATEDSALAKELKDCGRVVPPSDSKALAMAIISLIDSPDEREIIGKAARTRAMMRWDAEQILFGYEKEIQIMSGKAALTSIARDERV